MQQAVKKSTAPKKPAVKAATPSKAAPAAAVKKGAKENSAKSAPSGHEPALMALFVDELKDIYWAEKHLVKNLPKMSKAATSKELAETVSKHLEETKIQVSRLEEVFELLGKKAQAKKCDAMEGLVKEAQSIIEDTEKGSATRDVGIILAAQKVEHYEIATYGGLAQLATTLGLSDVAGLLRQTLDEEKQADEHLSGIAENDINYRAEEEA